MQQCIGISWSGDWRREPPPVFLRLQTSLEKYLLPAGQKDRRFRGRGPPVTQSGKYSELFSPAKWSALIENKRAGGELAER